jgi:hypothetical protein
MSISNKKNHFFIESNNMVLGNPAFCPVRCRNFYIANFYSALRTSTRALLWLSPSHQLASFTGDVFHTLRPYGLMSGGYLWASLFIC